MCVRDMVRETDIIHVLHVDDDPDFAAMTAEMLEDQRNRFVTETTTDVEEALQTLHESVFDCVVSDYDMPEQNGIEFLKRVRELFPELPFILFTGKGSEQVASEAISAGVTDYLQKGTGSERYELLANRIETAVGQYQAEQALERHKDLLEKSQDIAHVGAWEYDVTSDRSYVTDEVLRIHGLSPGESLPKEKSLNFYHPEDRQEVRSAFNRAVSECEPYDLEARLIAADGQRRWVHTRGEPQIVNGDVVRVRGTIQDITERKRRERRLERQNERLEEFAHVVSHDIRSPLQVASGQLAIAEQTGDAEAFEKVRQAHDRIEAIVEDILTLAQQGEEIGPKESVNIEELAHDAWASVDTSTVTLKTIGDYAVLADRDRLRQLFENLFKNAAEHAGEDVTVSVGPIEPLPTSTRGGGEATTGFYIADDGPGIPEHKRDTIFSPGYSTSPDGTGFGLSIVRKVVEAHEWDITVTGSGDGGARFEITGPQIRHVSSA